MLFSALMRFYFNIHCNKYLIPHLFGFFEQLYLSIITAKRVHQLKCHQANLLKSQGRKVNNDMFPPLSQCLVSNSASPVSGCIQNWKPYLQPDQNIRPGPKFMCAWHGTLSGSWYCVCTSVSLYVGFQVSHVSGKPEKTGWIENVVNERKSLIIWKIVLSWTFSHFLFFISQRMFLFKSWSS